MSASAVAPPTVQNTEGANSHVPQTDVTSKTVQDWLDDLLNNSGNFKTELSLADLKQLINQLEAASKTAAGKGNKALTQLLSGLRDIQQMWAAQGGTAVERLICELDCRKEVIKLIDDFQGPVAINDKVVADIDSKLAAVRKNLQSLLNTPSSRWSDSGTDTSAVVNARRQLDELKKLAGQLSSGEQTKLGLGKLISMLESALATYDSAPKGNLKEQQLALSQFRQTVAAGRSAYLQSIGASSDDARVNAENGITRTEKIWQDNLTIPWGEATDISDVAPVTRESIQSEIESLKTQYQMMVKIGNQTGMDYVRSRIAILDRGLSALGSKDSDLGTALNIFMEVKLLEIGTKKVFQSQALEAANNTKDPKVSADQKKLADNLATQINNLENLVKTAVDEIGGALTKYTEVTTNALANAVRG